MTQPTGVFVRLPLSEAARELLVDAAAFGKPDDSHDQAILSIGTPVTGGDIPVITTIGTLRDPIPCVHQSDHQAATVSRYHAGWVAGKRDGHKSYTREIAALEAEVGRLRAENEKLHRIAYSGRGTLAHTIHSPARFADEARKGPEA